MFYVNNQSDVYIETVKEIVRDFPVADAAVWIQDLITQIEAIPTAPGADAGTQASKSQYVIQSLQFYLTSIQTKVAAGLPSV
jgi:hypothetical protein